MHSSDVFAFIFETFTRWENEYFYAFDMSYCKNYDQKYRNLRIVNFLVFMYLKTSKTDSNSYKDEG